MIGITDSLLIIAVAAVCTFLTRALPFMIFKNASTPAENCISGECAAYGDHALSDCLLCTQYEFFSISVRSAGAAGNLECRTSSCVETQ